MTLDTKLKDDQILATIQQEYKILAEYKMVESEKIGGVYVIPSFENSLLWFGVIFVRKGMYTGGVFRFTILLPDQFPDDKTVPTVIFQNEIFHPFICPYTGGLDISNAFAYWRTGEDHVWQLLKYIKAIFADVQECIHLAECVATENGSALLQCNNNEAIQLLHDNRAEYIARVKNCVAAAKERVYDKPTTDDPHYISFESFNEDVHGPILERILTGKELGETNTHSGNGLSWVKEGEFKPLSVE